MFSIRDSRIHQRLLICLLLVLLVTTIKPVSAFNPGFTLVSTGSSEISWTDEVKKFDDHAIKLLYTDDQYLYVNLSIPTGVKIKDLAHWDYWSMTDVARFSPSIEFVLEDAATNIWVITLRPIESAITVGQWMNPSSTTSWNYVINTWLNDGYQTDYSSTEQTWSWVTTDFQEAVITGITIGNHRLSVTPVVTAYLDDFTMTAKTETYTYQFEPPAGPPPDIVYVNTAGTCSGQSPCFTTIQAGVDAVADAGVVIVEPGLYTENINIAKPVSLEGANTGNNPNTQERLPESTLDGTFTIGSSNVIVDGFEVIGDGAAFDSIGLASHVEIINNRMITKSADQVINHWPENFGSSNWIIADNYITDILASDSAAIAVKNIQTLTISGNRIEQTISDFAGVRGFILDGTLAANIQNNAIDLEGSVNGIGMIVSMSDQPSADILVSDNLITHVNTALLFLNQQDLSGFLAFGNEIQQSVHGFVFNTGLDPALPDAPIPLITNITMAKNKIETSDAVSKFTNVFDELEDGLVNFENIQFNQNQLLRLTAGMIIDLPASVEIRDGFIDADKNWWGSIVGPKGDQISSAVVFEPWCGSEGCDFWVHQDIHNRLVLAPDVDEFGSPMPILVEGGILLDEAGLSLVLSDGLVIQNSSPCFLIYASHVSITAENNGAAKCIPTAGDHGIEIASDVSNVEIYGLEIVGVDEGGIDQATGNGIHFHGAVHNVWIADNILQFLDGNGIHFTTQPTGTVQIQGNLFKENMGFGIHAPADINVAYNAWGKPSGPTPGLDLPAVITTYTPFTHAALELKPTSSITANTAVFQSQVTFDIFADLYNVWGAEINIVFPSEHLAVAELGLTSYGVFDFETFALSGQTIFFHGDQRALLDYEDEIPPGGPVQAPVKLFSITFNTLAFGKNLSLEFGEVNFSFAYQDGDVGVSNNVYSSKLVGIDDLQIIDLLQISTNLVNDSLISASGIEETFKITLNNPVEGGTFDHLQVNFMLHNAATENIFRFEFHDGAEWKDVKLQNDSFGNVIGWLDIDNGFSIQPNEIKHFDVRIVFKDSGSWAMDFFVEDLDTGWTLDQYSFDVEISVGNLIVSGTVFMQGRRERFGVSVSLVSDPSPGLPDHGTMTVTSSNAMENNIWFNLVNAGTYRITTQQPRYLNLSWELNKAITFDTDHTLPMDLWLYAGDANGDNVIDISDASIVGSLYGVGGINDNGDVNFDNRVNIQDLALVGGNYKLTAALAYAGWTP